MSDVCPELIKDSTSIMHSNGPFALVRRYYRGKHKELGLLHIGLTGWETIQETTIVKPNHIFQVTEEAKCE